MVIFTGGLDFLISSRITSDCLLTLSTQLLNSLSDIFVNEKTGYTNIGCINYQNISMTFVLTMSLQCFILKLNKLFYYEHYTN